jgi:hypothetical protein
MAVVNDQLQAFSRASGASVVLLLAHSLELRPANLTASDLILPPLRPEILEAMTILLAVSLGRCPVDFGVGRSVCLFPLTHASLIPLIPSACRRPLFLYRLNLSFAPGIMSDREGFRLADYPTAPAQTGIHLLGMYGVILSILLGVEIAAPVVLP